MNQKKFLAALLASTVIAGAAPNTVIYANEIKVQTDRVVGDTAEVSNFEVSNFTAYLDAFQVRGIKTYTTNGGKYGSSTLDKAFDGNKATHWETGKANSATHTNEIIVTFDEIEEINRMLYASRQDAGNKGYATKFSIYASLTEEGDDFELVAQGSAAKASGYAEFKFNPTQFKRLKFVFDEALNSWASAGELVFLTEDTVMDQVNRIFTDETKTAVSPEFASVEVLKALQEDAKGHPLYESIKETIEDACVLLESTEIVAGQANVSVFNYYDNAAYTERFKMSNSNIKSITTNGGHYSTRVIGAAIDDNLDTYWETSKANGETFNNEVTLELKDATTINRLVLGARQGDLKGFATEFEIYASETSSGDTFKLVSTGKHAATKGLIEAKFEPIKVKRIKLVFKSSTQNWATLNEIACYTEDEYYDKVNGLFTSALMNELSPEYNTLEKLSQLEKEIKGHPIESVYLEQIGEAKKLLNNEIPADALRVVTGEQRGAYGKGTATRYINGNAYASFESFGKYVTAGEEITVYVDADPNGVMPQLCFGQVGKGQGDWRRWVTLKPGKNVITVPANINPSAIYLVNNADETQQAYAPQVRIEGGTVFPTYFHGETDPQEFYDELVAYAKNIEYSDEEFADGNPAGKVFNIAEFVSENCVITTSAKGAILGLDAAAGQGYDIGDTMDSWEEMYDMFQTFLGLEKDAEDIKDRYFPNKFVARVFQNVPIGYADHGYTGYLGSNTAERDGGFFRLIAMPVYARGNDNWCYTHEFGHIFNTKYIVHGEVTNNLFAQEYRRIKGLGGDRVAWDSMMKRFQGETVNLHFWENLGILSQLNIAYGYDAYAKASSGVRENVEVIKQIEGSELRRLAVAYSLGLGVDVLDFFEGWGYTDVTPEMRAAVSHLPKETRKIEYLHNGAYDYEGTGFTEDVKVLVSPKIDKAAKTNTLTFSIDAANKDDLLGYEILKDGEVIGYTRTSSFVIKDVDVTENSKYEVVAYAKDLSTAKAVSTYAFEPTLKVVENVTLKLREAFNPLEYIVATNYEGEALENINVTHNVDMNQKGEYEVLYTVTDHDVTVSKTMKVVVVSDYDYLSDTPWTSVTTQHGTPRRNSDIKGRLNGKIQSFEKGFGIHANGEIVYDLGEHSYENFEAFVGVDMGLAEQATSSIQFEISVDGEVVAQTDVLKYADNMAYLNIPIAGAKELKITVNNGGNGNTLDHAVIVNPKLTNNNAKPTLNVEETFTTVALDSDFDITEGVSAVDAEDGDLTHLIKVDDGGLDLSVSGTYDVTYSITDSDNNTTSVSRKVVVYSTSQYVGDIDWVSATTSYSVVRKNLSNSGNTIKISLDGENITEFAKGIGAHANAEVVYDLTESKYEALETYVGVDCNLAEQNNSSIIFKIIADGEEVYNSGLMKRSTPAQFVSISLEGVKELRLIVDNGGNGNTLDHGVFADTKFLMTSSAPKLTVEDDVVLKVGETMDDIYGTYTAIDAEEGDLTSQVEVSGSVNFRQPGKYTITYTVEDREGHITTKERTISVVDMNDYTYVSDADWLSASCGWGSIRKDLSPSNNTIRLTDSNNQEVRFEKGLGTHAKSTIVYDLSTIDAGIFSTYVGVDRAMYNTVGSVSFEIYLDGEKVEDTGLMKAKDSMRYLEVNLAGAKELKLVATDGGNGNGSDHAVWGDAKFHFANPDNIATDFSKLEAYIDELNMLDSSRYTDESWTNLAEVKAQAEALCEIETASQDAVNEILQDLQAAKEALVRVGDKGELRELIATAKNLPGHRYTAETWEALQAIMIEAQEVLYDIPEQAVIEEAVAQLTEAMDALELSQGKMTLKVAVDSAEDFTAEEYDEAPMWDEFTALRDEARTVYYAVTTDTEDALSHLANNLEEVLSDLRVWKEQQKPQVDKTNLSDLVETTKQLDLRIYTKASKVDFANALSKATEVIASKDVVQDEVDEVTASLQTAMDNLMISNGKAELKKVLELAVTLDQADYTNTEYWDVFEQCYNHYTALYEEDWEEAELNFVHVYFMTVISDLETFGK